jgi:hypothetical protein
MAKFFLFQAQIDVDRHAAVTVHMMSFTYIKIQLETVTQPSQHFGGR